MSAKGLGSDATRHTSRANVLAPSSHTPRTRDDVAAAATDGSARKRKHDAYAMEDLLKPAIVVKVTHHTPALVVGGPQNILIAW